MDSRLHHIRARPHVHWRFAFFFFLHHGNASFPMITWSKMSLLHVCPLRGSSLLFWKISSMWRPYMLVLSIFFSWQLSQTWSHIAWWGQAKLFLTRCVSFHTEIWLTTYKRWWTESATTLLLEKYLLFFCYFLLTEDNLFLYLLSKRSQEDVTFKLSTYVVT